MTEINPTTGRHSMLDIGSGLAAGAGVRHLAGVFADQVWPSWLPGNSVASHVLGSVASGLLARVTRGGVSEGACLSAWLFGVQAALAVGAQAFSRTFPDGSVLDVGGSSSVSQLLGLESVPPVVRRPEGR